MKVQTFRRISPYTRKGSDGVTRTFNGEVLCVRVKCDMCPAVYEYEGVLSQAEAKVKGAGWAIGSTGVVRCPDCFKSARILMRDALNRTY